MNLPLTLTHRLPADATAVVGWTLSLTAEERTRSRHYFKTETGQPLYLNLPRGTVLHHNDLLRSEQGDWVRVLAKPEPVLTVRADSAIDLLRAAYHLGNRHVALEVTTTYLRLLPDPVLHSLIEQMGLQVQPETAPFSPEVGAYGHRPESAHG